MSVLTHGRSTGRFGGRPKFDPRYEIRPPLSVRHLKAPGR
jgi:hypothetical protein